MRSVGFVESMNNFNSTRSSLSLDQYESESSFVQYDKQEVGQKATGLSVVLKSLAKLSKEAQNDAFFIQEGLFSFVMEAITTIVNAEDSQSLNLLVLLLTTVKNISGNEEMRKKLLEVKNCSVFSNLLKFLNALTQKEKKLYF